VVLYKKAEELNVDISEFEMILHSKLYQKQQELSNSKPKSSVEKLGKIKKCPSCGEVVNPLDIKCSACGFELNITTSNQTLNEFLNKLVEHGETKRGNISNKTDIILHFPIPNNKEDLFEFLSICIPQIEQNTSTLNRFEKKILTAWLIKSRQLLIKGNSLFKDDKEFIKKISVLELQVDKKLKQIRTKNILLNSLKILILILFIIAGYLYWTEVLFKKSPNEILIKSVNKKYGKTFAKFKTSALYNEKLNLLEHDFKAPYFHSTSDSINGDNFKRGYKEWPASDIKFYRFASEARKLGNDNIANSYLDTALALNPNFVFALYRKGGYYVDVKKPDSALIYLNKTIELRNDVWEFYWTRSAAYNQKDMWRQALTDVEYALTILPNESYLQFLEIKYLSGLNWKTKAKEVWKNLILKKDFIKLKKENPESIKLMEEWINEN
jgi:tetratricopeptide (TPR) repeat protein